MVLQVVAFILPNQIYNIILGGSSHLVNLSKWVITPVINGISRVNPLIIGVIIHLLSGMSHQVYIYIYMCITHQPKIFGHLGPSLAILEKHHLQWGRTANVQCRLVNGGVPMKWVNYNNSYGIKQVASNLTLIKKKTAEAFSKCPLNVGWRTSFCALVDTWWPSLVLLDMFACSLNYLFGVCPPVSWLKCGNPTIGVGAFCSKDSVRAVRSNKIAGTVHFAMVC